MAEVTTIFLPSYLMQLLPLLLLLVTRSDAIPIDNGVEGEPEIECGPTSVTVNFNTRNPFEGYLFAIILCAKQWRNHIFLKDNFV
ncbi:unnamed protein product [Gongylonema pulchrum]|uniref:Secreted protein n=1 Tax=Gongylonema pulchrum TaxID=637853 RepID=A0A183CVE0_9BILA|nr:unnamed protein product [Gongylonema pulchrum]